MYSSRLPGLVLAHLAFALAHGLHAQQDFSLSSEGVVGQRVEVIVNGGAVLSTNWTFAAWIHPTVAGGRGEGQKPVAVVTSRGDPDVALESVEILLSDVGGTQRLELSRGTTFLGEPSTLPVPLNAWTHVAVTVSSTRHVKYYINGLPAGDFPSQYSARNVALGGASGSLGGAGAFTLMGNNEGRRYAGGLDEVQVWKTALTATEIESIRWGKAPAGDDLNLAGWFRFQEGSGNQSATSDLLPPGQPPASLAGGVNWVVVPHAEFTVTTPADEDDIPVGAAVSLREALREAGAGYGPATITFSPTLAGVPLVMQSPLNVPGGGELLIDGSGVTGGVLLEGSPGLSSTLLFFGPGATATLQNFAISNAPNGALFSQGVLEIQDARFTGNSSPYGGVVTTQGPLNMKRCEFSGNAGGALIAAVSPVTLTECQFTDNSGTAGGPILSGAAIFNQTTLTATDCQFLRNTAGSGGAIYNQGTLTVSRSLFEDNQTSFFGGGGALYNQGTVVVRECLLTGNSAGFGGGGAIGSPGNLTVINSTLHGNTAEPAGAIVASGEIFVITHATITGNSSGIWDRLSSLVMTNSVVSENTAYDVSDAPPGIQNFIGGTPLLSPLGDFGGPTHTRIPLPGSPLLDAATPIPNLHTDQRGFPRVVDGDGIGGAQPDIGAYEAGTWAASYTLYSWETLPADATDAQRAPEFDFDHDGQNNEFEWRAGTRAADASSTFSPTNEWEADSLVIRFPSASGRVYHLWASDALIPATWATPPGIDPIVGDGGPAAFTVPVDAASRRFFRVVPLLP